MHNLLRREKRGPEEHHEAPRRRLPEIPPPLMLLLADAGGIAAYQLNSFPSARSAEFYLDSTIRGALPEGSVLFWALTWRPTPTPDGEGHSEPLVLIRDVRRDVVYPFSFADLDSAYEFIRHEMGRGLDMGQVMVYWAVPARVEVDFWGRSTIVPPTAPLRPFRLDIPVAAASAPQPATVEAAVEEEAEDDGDFLADAAASVTEMPDLDAPNNGIPAMGEKDARYLQESDLTEVIRLMQQVSQERRAVGEQVLPKDLPERIVKLPITTSGSSRRSVADDKHELIDFPSATQKITETRGARQAWANISLAIDEALDVYAARKVVFTLAWNRIMRALGQAVQAQHRLALVMAWRNAAHALSDAARVEHRRRVAINDTWFTLAAAFGEAAGAQAAAQRDGMARAWRNAAHALARAANVDGSRKEMRKAWLNIAWTIEEAVFAYNLEHKARAIAGWRNGTKGLIEAVVAKQRQDALLRECWSTLCYAIGDACAAHEARLRMLCGAWQNAGEALYAAVEAKERHERIVTAMHHAAIAFGEALRAKAYRDAMVDAWDVLAGALVDAGKAQARHEGVVVAWQRIGVAADEVVAAFVRKQKQAIRAWGRIAKAINGALEAKARRDAAIEAWTNIGAFAREAVIAKQRYDFFVESWQNAGVALGELAQAKRHRDSLVRAWTNAGRAMRVAVVAKQRHDFFVECWTNASAVIADAVRACIAKQVGLERAWRRLSGGIADAARAKLAYEAAVAAWTNASAALYEAADAYFRKQMFTRAWSAGAYAIGEAVPVYEYQQSMIAAWTNASLGIKEALVAEAKLRIAQAGLDKQVMAEVEKQVKAAQKAMKTARTKKAEEAPEEPAETVFATEPAVFVETLESVTVIEVEQPQENGQAAASVEEDAQAGEGEEPASETETKESFRGLWRTHEAPRWEPRAEPFRGFNSPPGRFYRKENENDNPAC